MKRLTTFKAIVLLIGSAMLSIILTGYVLSILWGWFVVPVFTGAPKLSIVSAIGITMVVRFLTQQTLPDILSDVEEKDDEMRVKITQMISIILLTPPLVLFFGWIIYLFM